MWQFPFLLITTVVYTLLNKEIQKFHWCLTGLNSNWPWHIAPIEGNAGENRNMEDTWNNATWKIPKNQGGNNHNRRCSYFPRLWPDDERNLRFSEFIRKRRQDWDQRETPHPQACASPNPQVEHSTWQVVSCPAGSAREWIESRIDPHPAALIRCRYNCRHSYPKHIS